MNVVKHVRQEKPLPKLGTYVGKCCRLWVLAYGIRVGRCGICNEVPEFFGWDA
jgi:hypothetical protein